jgi:hypothetical protein
VGPLLVQGHLVNHRAEVNLVKLNRLTRQLTLSWQLSEARPLLQLNLSRS